VFLDANENPFGGGLNRYPDPQQKVVKQRLSELKDISTENILLGNGSDEVLDLLFRAFCEPGVDNVVILPPTYGMYKVLSGVNNVEAKEVLLDENFQPQVAEILTAAKEHTKMLFLCSPNNPPGNAFDKDSITELLNNFNGLVIIDEAYIDFCDQPSWINELSKHPNLVVTQTLSKAYGLAGIRLGICYASTAIIAILNKIKPPYNVNELTQQKGLEKLNDITSVEKEIVNILTEREVLIAALQNISLIEKVYPTDANFILAKVDDATLRYNQLVEKGIVVRNRTTQPLCENTLRLTVGTSKENEKLIKTLQLLS